MKAPSRHYRRWTRPRRPVFVPPETVYGAMGGFSVFLLGLHTVWSCVLPRAPRSRTRKRLCRAVSQGLRPTRHHTARSGPFLPDKAVPLAGEPQRVPRQGPRNPETARKPPGVPAPVDGPGPTNGPASVLQNPEGAPQAGRVQSQKPSALPGHKLPPCSGWCRTKAGGRNRRVNRRVVRLQLLKSCSSSQAAPAAAQRKPSLLTSRSILRPGLCRGPDPSTSAMSLHPSPRASEGSVKGSPGRGAGF